MRWLYFGFAVALMSACGNASPDYTVNFLGIWSGTSVLADARSLTVLSTYPATALISSTNTPNTVVVGGACNLPANSLTLISPTATATSATEFNRTSSYVCPKARGSTCADVVLTLTALGGTLNGSTLTINLAITEDYCGLFGYFTIDFTGTRQ